MTTPTDLLREVIDWYESYGDSPVEDDDVIMTLMSRAKQHLSQNDKPLVSLGLPFDSESFEKVWIEWETYRREKRSKLTDSTRKKQLAKCVEWGEYKAIKSINHSIEMGWIGLFEFDEKRGEKKSQDGKDWRSTY